MKCSLLFLERFSVDQKKLFDDTKKAAALETENKYAPEIQAERNRIALEIEAADEENDRGKRASLKKELVAYLKRMTELKTIEGRRLLKERFDYPIFMYEAEKVGITATGAEDENELYPNARQPADCDKTCLEWYREFADNPQTFAVSGEAA